MQAEINEVANQRIDNVKFAMNKRYFVRRNQQVDIRSITRNVPGSVTMMNDPDKDVKIQEPTTSRAAPTREQDRLAPGLRRRHRVIQPGQRQQQPQAQQRRSEGSSC